VLFGRRLAQALKAFWKVGLPAAEAEPAVAADPPAAAPPDRDVTPFFWRHASNAASDAVVEEDDDEEPALFVVVEVEELAELLHAPATRATVTIAAPMVRRRRVLGEVARRHTHRGPANIWSFCLGFLDRSSRDDLCTPF
jgi:hypothetical protein